MKMIHAISQEVISIFDSNTMIEWPEDGIVFSVPDEVAENWQGKECWTNGRVITETPPPSEFYELKDDGWKLNEEEQAKALISLKKQSAGAIDDAVALIYSRFARFQAEYSIREKQALTFKKNNYKGEVPVQVAAFAEPAELSPKQATDAILSQAAVLNKALESLGVLRMKKIVINKLQTIDEVKNHRDNLLVQIDAIAQQL